MNAENTKAIARFAVGMCVFVAHAICAQGFPPNDPRLPPVQPGTIQPQPGVALPPAPTQFVAWTFADIKVTVPDLAKVRIEWFARDGAASYRVFRNGAVIANVPGNASPLAVLDEGLQPGTTASYTVQAIRPPSSGAVVAGEKQGKLIIADPNKGGVTTDVLEESRTVTITTPTLNKMSAGGKVHRPPPPRWALKPEAPPSIPPNSKVLLFIHGMDSRAEEADGFTKALFSAPRPGFAPPPLAPISASRFPLEFKSCPNPASGCPDTCDNMDDFSSGQPRGVLPSQYFAPLTPPALLDMSPPPGTPLDPNARMNVPAGRNIGTHEGRLIPQLRAVAAAARPLDTLRMAAADFAAGNALMGTALADLAVTGSRSFAAFRQALPGEPFCQSLGAANIQNGCRTALDRAYRVANFLRTGQRGDTPALKAAKTAERNALGWIAVSGEDDLPHRPVNVPSSDFPQYDLQVIVPTPLGPIPALQVHTRYTIAQSQTPSNNLVVIAMDLPTSGYAGNLPYTLISPLHLIGTPKTTALTIPDFAATGATPLLDFIETFIVMFTEELHRTVPIKSIIKAVMGGSLGGNMTFRLGRRTDTPYLTRFVVWSPASIWDSLGAGADVLKHQGPLKAWQDANRTMNSPGIGDRAAFFASWDRPIHEVFIRVAQSDTWASDFYPCKKSSIAGARLDRQETYDRMFLAWHWRLGAEQLLFSHQNRDASGQPLFMSNVKPMLLACGVLDDVTGNNICPATQKTAAFMTATPGRAWFLGQTGHSVHDERHRFFALEVIQFLGL